MSIRKLANCELNWTQKTNSIRFGLAKRRIENLWEHKIAKPASCFVLFFYLFIRHSNKFYSQTSDKYRAWKDNLKIQRRRRQKKIKYIKRHGTHLIYIISWRIAHIANSVMQLCVAFVCFFCFALFFSRVCDQFVSRNKARDKRPLITFAIQLLLFIFGPCDITLFYNIYSSHTWAHNLRAYGFSCNTIHHPSMRMRTNNCRHNLPFSLRCSMVSAKVSDVNWIRFSYFHVESLRLSLSNANFHYFCSCVFDSSVCKCVTNLR